jgi:hypothetical protein
MTHKKARRQAAGSRRSLLPIALIGGALVLAVIAIGIGIMSADAGASGGGGRGPQLAVNQEKIDFGNLPFDKTVRAEFKVENTGDRNLTLDVSTPIRVVEGC